MMKKLIATVTFAACAAMLMACEDPAANKTKAITGDASPAANGAGQAPAPVGLDQNAVTDALGAALGAWRESGNTVAFRRALLRLLIDLDVA